MLAATISNCPRFLLRSCDEQCLSRLRSFRISANVPIDRRRTTKEANVEIIDDGLPKDYRVQVFRVSSRRLDALVGKAIGKGRGQAEKLIMTGKVQVNEEDVEKKVAYYVQENDIIDIWKEPVDGNAKLAEVHRIEIINYALIEQGYEINLKSWKRFYVHNWRDKK